MADIPRLNGVIRALEAGKPTFTSFCQADPETAIAMSAAKYDGIVYEMEHNPWDIRLKSAPLYEPAGIRGDGPTAAVRYWGLSQQDYYARADVWPLNPKGEVFVILMMEDTRGIEALPDILKKVPGIGAILIGEGDLSQELGYPRQYEHPEVLKWMARVVDTCKQHNVVVGHPHVDASNVERILGEGYRFLMAAPVRSYAALDKGLKLAGRA